MVKYFALLSLLAFLFVGCEKEDDKPVEPEPVPVPETTTKGLILHLPFNNSLNDASSEANNARIVGGSAAYHYDRYFDQGSALRLNQGQYLEVTDRKFSALDSFTFYIEFNPTGSGYQSLISKRAYTVVPGTKYNSSFNIAINDFGQARSQLRRLGQCQVESPLSFFPEITSGGEEVMVDCWNYIACSFNGRVQKLYLNGKLVAQQSIDTMEICDTDPLRIGSWWQGDSQFFDGILDEVRVYNRVLTDTEIFQLYKLGKK
jgi:hypothetical protein